MKITISALSLAGIVTSHAALFTSGEIEVEVAFNDDTNQLELVGLLLEGGVLDGNTLTENQEMELDQFQILGGANVIESFPVDVAASGVTAGQDLWVLPQSENFSAPFLGIASADLNAADFNGNITFSLGSVASPSGNGVFSVLSFEPDGSTSPIFSSLGAELTDSNNELISEFSEQHVNWTFTEPGAWEVEFTATGDHVALGELSATGTVQFLIVPEPSSSLLIALSAIGFISKRRR